MLFAEREIVNRSEQHAIVEDACADADDGLAGFERIVSDGEARPEVVVVVKNCFDLIAQSVTDRQVRARAPLVLREEAQIVVALR